MNTLTLSIREWVGCVHGKLSFEPPLSYKYSQAGKVKNWGKFGEFASAQNQDAQKPRLDLSVVSCQLLGNREEGTGNREQNQKRPVVRSQESGVRVETRRKFGERLKIQLVIGHWEQGTGNGGKLTRREN